MIAHKKQFKIAGVIWLVIVMIICQIVPAFASPSLSDATITYSVKGYYSQYLQTPSYTYNKTIDAEGNITDTTSYTMLSDYVAVSGGGSFAFFYSNSIVALRLNICFYDSSYNVVSGGFVGTSVTIVDIPSGVSFVRFSQSYSSNLKILNSPFQFNTSSYQYLFAEFDGITIDEDGIISIPYQTWGYEGIYLDFQFYDTGFKTAQTISFDYYAYFSQHHDVEKVGSAVSFSSDGVAKYAYLNSYYISNGETVQFTSGESSSNLNPDNISCQTGGRYSGFVFTFPVVPSSVSTAISIKFSNFAVDGVDTDVSLTLGKAGDDLSNLAEELAVPTPDTDAIFNGMDDAINHVNDSNYQSTYSFFKNDTGIMATYITIVLAMATLGYIFFGKRSA